MKTVKITKNQDGKLVALFEEDQAYLSQWLRRIRELEEGEIMTAHLDAQASQPLNAWHHILIAAVYKAQERFTNKDAFRKFLYMMAGYSEEVKIKRKRVLVPSSWSFDSLPNDFERQEVHNKVVMAMHDEDVQFALWPHLKPAARMEMMLTTIQKAEEERERARAAKAFKQAQRARALQQPEAVAA